MSSYTRLPVVDDITLKKLPGRSLPLTLRAKPKKVHLRPCVHSICLCIKKKGVKIEREREREKMRRIHLLLCLAFSSKAADCCLKA